MATIPVIRRFTYFHVKALCGRDEICRWVLASGLMGWGMSIVESPCKSKSYLGVFGRCEDIIKFLLESLAI